MTLDALLWHVMTHEVRHTAQIVLLIRLLGHTPPWLDYLRFVRPQPAAGVAVHAAAVEGVQEDGDLLLREAAGLLGAHDFAMPFATAGSATVARVACT